MNGYGTYLRNQNITQAPRDIEYRLLAQVTAALIDAESNPENFTKRAESLTWNRRVWGAFRIDLIDPSNALSTELKASLVSLAIWVERETFEILKGKGNLHALITVNKHIMEGLQPSAADSPSFSNMDHQSRNIAVAG